ncbi:unnamed protein product [Penicillium salamii]|uniref:Uncharacterized protein n=1 Tax=Penicillium salamii TaxID=1612424 RepID=A0A9W4NXG3_9EURO|nr:unnamed protein product [Penicillium salamii]CAG7950633.1 unnamed protein product [Penicillium salamii]CAG8006746.1 unnamed protein product [Penicillium salamii]CAG8050120.1 unnamed protein product [Penicillium salamii]CAG8242582.1 unnamed protein product [Penicillium salamii]
MSVLVSAVSKVFKPLDPLMWRLVSSDSCESSFWFTGRGVILASVELSYTLTTRTLRFT